VRHRPGSRGPGPPFRPRKARTMDQPVVIMAQPLYGPISSDAHGRQMHFLGLNEHLIYHWYRDEQGIVHAVPQAELREPAAVSALICGYTAIPNAYVDWARNEIVLRVLTRYPQATHILFVDQDMDLP